MLKVEKLLEMLRDARNISDYDGWNVPEITQPITRLFYYCAKPYRKSKLQFYCFRLFQAISVNCNLRVIS